MVPVALDAAALFAPGITARADMHTVKPLDRHAYGAGNRRSSRPKSAIHGGGQ
jgi:transketolase C-terminal domain/subunit